MKIVNISGGLGNQMFQCAFAMALKLHFPDECVFIDTHHYKVNFLKKFRNINLHNGFEVADIFPRFPLQVADKESIRNVTYYIPNYWLSRCVRKFLPKKKTEYLEKRNFVYDTNVWNVSGNTYYEGYWQALGYISDIRKQISKIYSFPSINHYSQKVLSQILASDSVGIHVRRGDYLKDPDFGGICGERYYSRAIALFLSDENKHTFFVFSNDIEWCKSHFEELLFNQNIIYVDGNMGNESMYDMYLMSQCHNLIIANSTFSWWGAFLNDKGGSIIAPSPWVDRDVQPDIYEPSWRIIKADDRIMSKFRG